MSQPAASSSNATSTPAEEVWKAMFNKAVEEKNSATETNNMYMKMLEACAEQNNIAERSAIAAKKEAGESQSLALEADEQRKEAIIALQKTETQFAGKLNEQEAKSAELLAALTAQLEQAHTANNQSCQHLNSEVKRLTTSNMELRNELCIASGCSSILPRKITQKANEVRSEMAQKLAAANAGIWQSEQRNKNLQQHQAIELTQKQREIDAQTAEITRLKEVVLEEKEKRVVVESDSLAKIRAAQDETAAQDQQVQEARQKHAEVQAKLDQVVASAEGELHKVVSDHGAALRALEESKADAETKLAQLVASLSAQFESSTKELTERNVRLQSQLDAKTSVLAETRAALAAANSQLQKATGSKNQALKSLRDKMLIDAQSVVELLNKRTAELKDSQEEYRDSLLAAKTVGVEMETVRRSLGAQSLELQQKDKEGELEKLQQAIVQAESNHSTLQKQFTAKEAEILDLQLDCGKAQEVIKQGAFMSSDRMAQISGKHLEEMAVVKASLSSQLAQLAKELSDKASEMHTEVERLQSLVAMNAETVQSAQKNKTSVVEAEAKIASLQRELAANNKTTSDAEEDTPVGKKRRRK